MISILIVIVLTISLRTKLCQIIQFKIQRNFSASMSTINKNENIIAISNEKNELDTYADNEGQNNSSAEMHKVSCDEDTSRLYSVVDRSKKKETKLRDDIFNPSNISEMYATVDKKAKGKIKLQDSAGSGSTVTDLYAVVDKKAKRKPIGKAAETTSGNISDMYMQWLTRKKRQIKHLKDQNKVCKETHSVNRYKCYLETERCIDYKHQVYDFFSNYFSCVCRVLFNSFPLNIIIHFIEK